MSADAPAKKKLSPDKPPSLDHHVPLNKMPEWVTDKFGECYDHSCNVIQHGIQRRSLHSLEMLRQSVDRLPAAASAGADSADPPVVFAEAPRFIPNERNPFQAYALDELQKAPSLVRYINELVTHLVFVASNAPTPPLTTSARYDIVVAVAETKRCGVRIGLNLGAFS